MEPSHVSIMTAYLTLPCGCRITDSAVLGMCMQHAHELRKKELENEAAYRAFERNMRGADQPDESL